MTGCPIRCKGCFNPDLWEYDVGKPYNKEALKKIREELERDWIDGVTVLGGEPLAFWNLEAIREITQLAWRYGKNSWVWTGFTFETLSVEQKKALDFCDVLVDGPFVEELKDLSLKWRGSSNQRILDCQASLKAGKAIIKKEEM